jgi:predicted ATP-binding protein involved in virulence
MHIKELQLQNFRGFKELILKFPPKKTKSNFAVLIGINGSGKSSILDSISILLTSLLYPIIFENEGYIKPTKNYPELEVLDRKNKTDDTQISLEFLLDNHSVKPLLKTQYGIITKTIHKEFRDLIVKKLKMEPNSNVPICVHYRTNRLVNNISIGIPKPKSLTFPQFDTYDGCTAFMQNDFTTFFEWFRNQEDIENEERLEHNDKYRDKQLQLVKAAITCLLGNEYTNLRVKRIPPQMIVYKDEEELNINQLSGGEKGLLAMVGDIARRLAIANPSLDDPLKGEGVILIDEIELHLHPQWQRKIIPDLTSTFPNCQFIVTTHSPQVLSDVERENVFILEDFELVEITPHTKGRDSNSILYELMGVAKRPEYSQKIIDRCYRLIDEGQMEDAKKELEILSNYLGEDDAQVVELHALIFFSSLTDSNEANT